MATIQTLGPTELGFLPLVNSPATTTFALSNSGANVLFALGFVPLGSGTKTVTSIRAYISAVTGTVAAGDITCAVYGDSGAGQPGSSLSSVANGSGIAAGTFVDWTGLSQVVTCGQQNYAVFSNGNASPAANFPTFLYGTGNTMPRGGGTNNNYGSTKWQWAPSTWSGGSGGVIGLRVGFSDGTYSGLLVSAIATGVDSAFGAHEFGQAFQLPAGPSLNVAGLAFAVRKIGSPTGNVVLKLYTGGALGGAGVTGTLAGITNPIPLGNLGTNALFNAYFPATVVVPGGSVGRLVVADTAADALSNCFKSPFDYVLDTDANSLALAPLGGTAKYGTATTNGVGTVGLTATFTDETGPYYLRPFGLLLDTAGEFASGGGGGAAVIGSSIITGGSTDLMSYEPGDAIDWEFTTQRFDTGAATDADSLPVVTVSRNGTDTDTSPTGWSGTLAVTRLDAGRYRVAGTVPAGYAAGDSVVLTAAATVNSVAGKARILGFCVDKRVADIASVALPGSPTAGTVGAALKSANTALGGLAAPATAGGLPTIGAGNGQFNIAAVNVTPTTPTTGGGGGGGVNL